MNFGLKNKLMKLLTPKLFKFPLNSVKESEKIHEALSINFFISSSRNDKTDKKKIKLSGFAFLDYLFDHRYFIYNNYVSSWQQSSFFPKGLQASSIFLDEQFHTKTFSFKNSRQARWWEKLDQKWPIFKKIYPHNWDKKTNFYKNNITSISFIKQYMLNKTFNSHNSIKSSYNKVLKLSSPKSSNIIDILSNGSLFTNKYHALISKNPRLWFCRYRLLNKNVHSDLLASFVYNNKQKTYSYFDTNQDIEAFPWMDNPWQDGEEFMDSYKKKWLCSPRKRFLTELWAKENYPLYFTTTNTLLKTLTWRFLKKIKQTRFKKIWPWLMQPAPLKVNSLSNKVTLFFCLKKIPEKANLTRKENGQNKPVILKLSNRNKPINTFSSASVFSKPFTSDTDASVVYPLFADSEAIPSNRLLASLVSILNRTNFRDVLFERFMNTKFYDIGLMGRKRLNKKLRLNVPLQCTTLTPLDFLAIFYKLFSLYNNFSLIQNFLLTEGNTAVKTPLLGDSFVLNPKINPWSNSISEIHHSLGSVGLRQLMSTNLKGATLPLAIPGVGNVFKPRNNLLETTVKQSSSLDHLNQRHIRTSGEFLFLQFWRAILRFYQVLSQLSNRSNFILSSNTAAGKIGRNFFSLSSISLFPYIQSESNNQKHTYLGIFKASTRIGQSLEKKLWCSSGALFSRKIEYILPISNNQAHVSKAYGYFNSVNYNHDSFNFNSYQYQCFQNTMSGEFVGNLNNTNLLSNKVVGSYPTNFRRETLNIIINRNDVNSILPYSPYFQTSSIYTHRNNRWPYLRILNNGAQKTMLTCNSFKRFAIQQSEWDLTRTVSLPEFLNKNPWKPFKLKTSRVKKSNFMKNTMTFKWFQKPGSIIKSNFNQAFPFYNNKMGTRPLFLNKTGAAKFTSFLVSQEKLHQSVSQTVDTSKAFIHSDLSSKSSFGSTSRSITALPATLNPVIQSHHKMDQTINTVMIPWKMVGKNKIGETMRWKMIGNLVSNLKEPVLNSKIETIIKKLLYETKELRVFDAKERMRNLETKLFNGVFKEFFNLDPLSQDLDETNGLAEIIHKRRISALGKGGVTSKNAPLSIRSIHPSFYGRLCPIDSPEGDRVGLINSLTNYARINSIGYIATPFYRTRNYDDLQPYVFRKPQSFSFYFNQSKLNNQYYENNALPYFSQWFNYKNTNINRNNHTKIILSKKLNEKNKISSLSRTETRLYGFKTGSDSKKSTLQMRICPPIAFFGKIYKSSDVSPSIRLSSQDILYNFSRGTIGWTHKKNMKPNNHKQHHSKQMIFQIGSTHIERTYKYFMKSSYLRPYQIKAFPLEMSLIGLKPMIGNSFVYRSKQSQFRSTEINNFRGTLEPMPFFGFNKNQQRGSTYSNFQLLPENWKETIQNDFSYSNQNLVTNQNNKTILRKLELFLFYDTHYMTPPITHRETIINNPKSKNTGHIYTPFLTCYFDFIAFQGYSPITAFQFFSPGVSLIPFLEHDDGTRALMGANMQRQAVPLISASRPIVGTGLEKNIAASFIISSFNSGYLYYISGKQSKQIFTGLSVPLGFQFSLNKVASELKTKNLKRVSRFQSIFLRKFLPFRSAETHYNFKMLKASSLSALGKKLFSFVGPMTSNRVFFKPTREREPVFLGVKQKALKKINYERICIIENMAVMEDLNCSSLFGLFQTFYNQKPTVKPKNNLLNAWQPKINYKKKLSRLQNNQEKSENKEGQHFILNTHWLPYRKSYKATIINKKPAIVSNSWLQKGDLLVDGTSSINGELALGRNLFSIYMPWEGYNFEDAILISDKAAESYTTIHVEEFSIKISKNEFVSSIVKPFTWVNLGDILVSKKRKLENEFIMNRLLFGMSSKPKMKDLDNDSLNTRLSTCGSKPYNFYGRPRRETKPVFNSHKTISKTKNPSSYKKMFNYIVSPWQNKLWNNASKHTQNFSQVLSTINRPKAKNLNRGQKLKLSSLSSNVSYLQDNDRSRDYYKKNDGHVALENTFMSERWAKTNQREGINKKKKLSNLPVKNSLTISLGDKSSPMFKIKHRAAPVFFTRFPQTIYCLGKTCKKHSCFFKKKKLDLDYHLSVLRYKPFFMTENNGFVSKIQEIRDEILNNCSQLNNSSSAGPFFKTTISGETSSLVSQAFRVSNEVDMETVTMLDDKQSSLIGINEKDFNALSSRRNDMGRVFFGSALKKNDNFEIDTSYRTSESICGWVISVKSQSQQSLVSESENKDRVRVFDTKTPQIVEQNQSKNSMVTPPVQQQQRVPSFWSVSQSADTNKSKKNTINTASKAWQLSKEKVGIYTDSIQKFLNELSIFHKTVQLKNHRLHEIKKPWIPVSHHKTTGGRVPAPQRGLINKTIFQPAYEFSKKTNPIGYLLAFPPVFNEWRRMYVLDKSRKTMFKNHFETSCLVWPKKARKTTFNNIILEWSKGNSKLQVFNQPEGGNQLLFSSLPNKHRENKPWLFPINPANVLKVKTERASLKTTKNVRQRPGSDMIYIYVAVAKPLQVGDKMSGRHGNKGIISKILPFYDMPYLIDGTPIDIILNPLGVPSRMNVGQIYESLLGLTGFYKQEYYRIPPFDENYSSQFSRNFVYWKLNELKRLHFFTYQIFSHTNSKNASKMAPLSSFFNSQFTSLVKTWPLPFKNLELFEKNNSSNFLQPSRFKSKTPFNKTYNAIFNMFLTQNKKNCLETLNTLTSNPSTNMKKKTWVAPAGYKTVSTINWNRSLLCCPKSKLWNPPNHYLKGCITCDRLNKFNHLKFFSTHSIFQWFGSVFRKNWFFTFASPQSKYCLSSKSLGGALHVNNAWASTHKYHLDTSFLNKAKLLPSRSDGVEKFGLNPYFPGKMRLLNGLTGETFYRPIIVGKSYMLKLIHLVHHKIHARATGPYALITQQPLKGKRNQGGQRMGEMEIWALYGFGSASVLYEMLTIKSDDPVGRERILREIAGLKGNNSSNYNWKNNDTSSVLELRESRQFWKNEESTLSLSAGPSKINDSLEKGISESFRVLVMNLRALCLDMQVFKDLAN